MTAPVMDQQPQPESLAKPARPKLPAGHQKQWYERFNRMLKAMDLVRALAQDGVFNARSATDKRIRRVAAEAGIKPPSAVTCELVRALFRLIRTFPSRSGTRSN